MSELGLGFTPGFWAETALDMIVKDKNEGEKFSRRVSTVKQHVLKESGSGCTPELRNPNALPINVWARMND